MHWLSDLATEAAASVGLPPPNRQPPRKWPLSGPRKLGNRLLRVELQLHLKVKLFKNP